MILRNKLFLLLLLSAFYSASAQPKPFHNLQFSSIPTRWDEGIPLGNGILGALIWQKENKLRFSLDNVFLWDDRPMPKIDSLDFNMVQQKLAANDYRSIQQLGDEPYEANPAPTKIPGAALEINIAAYGKVKTASLDLATAIAHIEWESGTRMESFISASGNAGLFHFYDLDKEFELELIPPAYQQLDPGKGGNSVQGQGLEQLGYKQGKLTKTITAAGIHQTYFQKCFGKTAYQVTVFYKIKGRQVDGYWTIQWIPDLSLFKENKRIDSGRATHLTWWKKYWNASSLSVPDSTIEKQYYRELYKFGSVARSFTPPISLQAIWTADNGRLPPWKGDLHHDLNTQLSYWPGYTANHLELTAGYTNWLWKTRVTNRKWTKQYFEVEGINVPGVTTISGAAMGGWIQYSMSPTTIAWLAQHVYWQYKFSLDPNFLKNTCYPYFKDAERYLTAMLKQDKNGQLQLPLSSSPEIHDNDARAWFTTMTNYDLALLKSFYSYCVEVYTLNKDQRLNLVEITLLQLPDFAVNEKGLSVAKGEDQQGSHRHLSPYMAIYPMQLLDIHKPADSTIINNSVRWIEKLGTREWCGYSFSWMASVYAKALESKKALQMLQIFASNFVSTNSFHLNGDQRNGEYSSYTYRPFTLEGNFAFAQGLHEILLQCQDGVVSVFPALPEEWKDVYFNDLRTMDAFLVSAQRSNGINRSVKIRATQDATLTCRLPFRHYSISGMKTNTLKEYNGVISQKMKKGQVMIFTNLD